MSDILIKVKRIDKIDSYSWESDLNILCTIDQNEMLLAIKRFLDSGISLKDWREFMAMHPEYFEVNDEEI